MFEKFDYKVESILTDSIILETEYHTSFGPLDYYFDDEGSEYYDINILSSIHLLDDRNDILSVFEKSHLEFLDITLYVVFIEGNRVRINKIKKRSKLLQRSSKYYISGGNFEKYYLLFDIDWVPSDSPNYRVDSVIPLSIIHLTDKKIYSCMEIYCFKSFSGSNNIFYEYIPGIGKTYSDSGNDTRSLMKINNYSVKEYLELLCDDFEIETTF